jgi:uncharacterized protein (DUF885 family)
MTSKSSPPERETFGRLVDDYYRAWFRFHPEAAVGAGVDGYAHVLTPFDQEASAALECLNDELLVGLNEIDRAHLDADARLDLDVLYGAAWLENRYLVEILPHRVDPARTLPVNALYQLTILPVRDFAGSLAARLEAVPGHLAHACDYLRDKASRIPALWLQSALAEARGGAEFVRDLPQHPKVANTRSASVETLIAQAERALLDHATFLETEIAPHAHADFACGRAHFDELLRYRHFLDVNADELHAFGTSLFERTQNELQQAAEALLPGGGRSGAADIAAAIARLQAQRPAAEDVIALYRERMRAAHEFVASRALVTVPAPERLEVVETPVFLRHQIPFAAYSEPAPNDPSQVGHYYVTPPTHPEQLAEHHLPGIAHTCVHEAWPGHHLQFVTANLNPVARSLPRLLNTSATLYEGWALYSEQLMHEQGFLSDEAQHFLLLRDRLWRALRIVIDVEIHTRGLSVEQAAARLTQHLGFPRSQALAELAWYTKAPTVPLGYATGWALINALRTQQQSAPTFSLHAFHDRLLSAGSVALPLVIQRAFGNEAWQAARDAVFVEARDATP